MRLSLDRPPWRVTLHGHPISNSIYPRIGYRPLIDTIELRFS